MTRPFQEPQENESTTGNSLPEVASPDPLTLAPSAEFPAIRLFRSIEDWILSNFIRFKVSIFKQLAKILMFSSSKASL